jgi:transposase
MKKLLNVKDIVVADIRFEVCGKDKALIVTVRPTVRQAGRCGICGKKSPGYDTGTKGRQWRSLDFSTFRVYIECDLPRVCCKGHGVVAARVPWARHDSWFTRAFEDTVAWLMLHATRSCVSDLMRIAWETTGDIAKRVYEDLKGKVPDPFDGLVRIGIDETSYKKGHKYMTVIVDHDTGALIWAAKGHGKKILDSFFCAMTEEQRDSIKFATGDGAGWITDCVGHWCKNAERCIDPFHVVQWATEVLDNIRKGAWRDARSQKPDDVKRSRGRPKKGEGKTPDEASAIKGTRYALLKNPENRTGLQDAQLELIVKSNPMLYRAYLLKEKLRLLFKLPLDQAREELDSWIKWAQHCRIPEFVELQRKIRRHKDAILAAIGNGLSNARIEAVNNKIKVTIRMGYGFRNIDNLIALLMLRCSKLDVALPGRA